MKTQLRQLLQEVRACTICEPHLPHGVRPIVQISSQAKILIAGQAPGRKVHETGVPFDDPSGDQLRRWLGVGKEVFYDPSLVAILPMGFCYPGTGKSGDLAPRAECAREWREKLLEHLEAVELTLVIGAYAQKWHFGTTKPVTELVKGWKSYWPKVLPLPHPSPRNRIWLKNNPWFEEEIVPALQQRVSGLF